MQVVQADLHDRLSFEHVAAGKQVVADGAKGIEVGSRVDSLRVLDRLGAQVVRRALDRHRVGLLEVVDLAEVLHEAEVEHLRHVRDASLAREHDVARLDVPVDQTDVVGFVERERGIAEDAHDPLDRLRPPALTTWVSVAPLSSSIA